VAAFFCTLAAGASAGNIPEPPDPSVSSGEIGIQLAEGLANGSSVLGSNQNFIGGFFPWSDDFGFPPPSPPTPPQRPPVNFPDGAAVGGFPGFPGGGSGTPVPEPEPALLLALGLTALVAVRRQRLA